DEDGQGFIEVGSHKSKLDFEDPLKEMNGDIFAQLTNCHEILAELRRTLLQGSPEDSAGSKVGDGIIKKMCKVYQGEAVSSFTSPSARLEDGDFDDDNNLYIYDDPDLWDVCRVVEERVGGDDSSAVMCSLRDTRMNSLRYTNLKLAGSHRVDQTVSVVCDDKTYWITGVHVQEIDIGGVDYSLYLTDPLLWFNRRASKMRCSRIFRALQREVLERGSPVDEGDMTLCDDIMSKAIEMRVIQSGGARRERNLAGAANRARVRSD
ncbi:hypothetical protein FOZ63_003912, partial [Perkinsus olseni]